MHSFKRRPLPYALLAVAIWATVGIKCVYAQGIERQSIAGEDSAHALHQANVDNQPYNFQVGPVSLRMDAGGTVSFNDNINLADTHKQADLILEPNGHIHALWQATEQNALTFDLGIGYKHYVEHSVYDALVVTPASNTQFNIFVDDFKITLMDSFSYQDDPAQVGQLSNTPQFSRFTNDAGLKVTWDLNDMIVGLGYDHTNFWVFQSSYQYLTYQQDAISPDVTFVISPTISAGLRATFSDLRYDQNIQNDYMQVQGGPFVTAQVTENLSVNAQAGWVSASFEQGGRNGDNEDIESYFCSAGISHRINDVISQSLTVGREYLPGITSNFTERVYARYSPNWQATTALNVSGQLWWENLNDSQAAIRQTSDRFGVGINFGLAVTTRLSLNLGYQYIIKTSDVQALEYEQNLVTLGASYQF